MDQLQAIANVLESCARLLRHMGSDGASELVVELTKASRTLDETAERLLVLSDDKGRRNN